MQEFKNCSKKTQDWKINRKDEIAYYLVHSSYVQSLFYINANEVGNLNSISLIIQDHEQIWQTKDNKIS